MALICPHCRRGLAPGPAERCPFCGALIGAPVEGSLAPEPRLDSPEKTEPLREIPALRRRERTWKDEVRERVRQRKQDRSGGELPLFPDEQDEAQPLTDAAPMELGDAPEGARGTRLRELDEQTPSLDLPLRHADERLADIEGSLAGAPIDQDMLDEPPAARRPADQAESPVRAAAPAVERPARAFERGRAAALDLALLLALWALVVYFASRAAHVPVVGLRPSWPYLAGYLAALGLIYAGYFTGTTGQTLGKIACGLRVVDPTGQPPGYLRASTRALMGSLGVLLAGGALVPMAFDPARRALHDRLLKTRVVRG